MPLKKILNIILAISFITTPAYPRTKSPATNKKSISYKQVFSGDPTWDQFAKGKWDAPRMGPFRKNDPILDDNPFFLNGQSWKAARIHTNASTRVEIEKNGLTIQLPTSRRELQLSAPIKPLFEDDDYLFFTADSTEVFERKSSGEDSYGEGLFFIDKALLTQEAYRPDYAGAPRPVPVFFFPLVGKGWTKRVVATQLSDFDILALKNSNGQSMTLDMDDIHLIAKVERQNLLLATINSLKHQPDLIRKVFDSSRKPNPNIELPFVLPPAGSTAAFGLYYTGLDLENTDRSLYELEVSKNIIDYFFPKAHAESMLSPDVLERLIIVGQITGTVFVASVLAKYSILKNRMLERRDFIEKQDDLKHIEKNEPVKDRTRFSYKVKREAVEWIDVFSHGLATISAGITTMTGHLLEYGADRLWTPGTRVNKMARKFLEYSFLYNRKQNENIAANAQTFFLGVVILGGIDTSGVVLQLLLVSPVFFPWAAQIFGDRIHEQVSQDFSGHSESTNNLVTSEIMRNLAAYFVSGAYSYSSAQRQKIMEDVTPIIEADMLHNGRNPFDPKNHRELEARIEREIERMLIERGLPSQKEFLFSSPSVIRSIAHMMGYKVDRTKLIDGESDQFTLETARWGLISHALKKSTKIAKELELVSPSAELKTAIRLLEDLKLQYNVIYRSLKQPLSPVRNIKEAIEARRIITAICYEGDLLSGPVKHLNIWPAANENPKAAQIAGKLIRQSFFSLVQNKPYILQPDTLTLEKYMGEAEAEATLRINEVIPKDEQTDTDKKILALEIVKEKVENELQKNTTENWAPPKVGWLEQRQINKADQYALNQVTMAAVANPDFTLENETFKPQAIEVYRESYRKKMSELVGLHTYPEEQSEVVRTSIEAANKELENALETNEGLRSYYNKLNDSEKLKFAAHMYAKAFLQKYTNATVSNSSLVSLTSPEQPGFFQRLRQTKFISAETRTGRFLTGALRATESLFDSGSLQPGAKSWRKRMLPFSGDFSAVLEIKSRQFFTAITAGWFTNYYFWQVHIPWSTYLFFFGATGFTLIANYWLDRMMINMGIRPMDTTWDKVKYSFLYTWLTYPTFIPFFFFVNDWNKMTATIAQKVSETATVIAASPTGVAATQAAKACLQLLGGG